MAYLSLGTLSTSAPSAATDGVALAKGENAGLPDQGFVDYDGLVLVYRATVTAAETATMSFLRMWGFSRAHGGGGVADDGDWYPVDAVPGTGVDSDRGKLNNGVALGEIATGLDQINFTQIINGLGAFERVYLQLGTSGGAGYADGAWLIGGR